MLFKMISARVWRVVFAVACFTLAPAVATPGVKPDVRNDSVAGTTWSGPESSGERTTWTFEEGGILSYQTPNGSYRNGTWKQTGDEIYFETNNRYAQYVGDISGQTMQGRAWNKNMKWTWKAMKKE